MTLHNIGPNVRRLRLAAGWSQDTLSSQLGTSKVWVSQVERGTSHVNVARLLELSEIFATSPNALLASCQHCEDAGVVMHRAKTTPPGPWTRALCPCSQGDE